MGLSLMYGGVNMTLNGICQGLEPRVRVLRGEFRVNKSFICVCLFVFSRMKTYKDLGDGDHFHTLLS